MTRMIWYKQVGSKVRQYCAEGTFDHRFDWKKVGRIEELVRKVSHWTRDHLGFEAYRV